MYRLHVDSATQGHVSGANKRSRWRERLRDPFRGSPRTYIETRSRSGAHVEEGMRMRRNLTWMPSLLVVIACSSSANTNRETTSSDAGVTVQDDGGVEASG